VNFITVTTDAIPEIIELGDVAAVVETESDSQVFDVTPSGPDVITETVADASVVVETQSATFTDHWVEAQIVETALQGPPGPPGPTAGSYPAKHLTYVDGQLVEVMMFHDAAATQIAEQRVLTYTDGALSSIQYYDVLGVLLNTRTFAYVGGVLSAVTDS